MEKVTPRKQRILDALDEEIEELEKRLKKVQPLLDELNTLRRTRAALLDERRATGGGGRANAQLTMETVIHDLRENGASTVGEIATRVGVGETIVRSHLNRYRDQRYAQIDGHWSLIGTEADDDEEDDEEEADDD